MNHHPLSKVIRLTIAFSGGLFAVAALLFFMGHQSMFSAQAAPVPPPDGYPKLSLSTKIVTPTLAYTDGERLEYLIEIVNTGAYTAEGVTLEDNIPNFTTFTGKTNSSQPPSPSYTDDVLSWNGTVGFDSVVVITFSVDVDPGYAGIISNTAVIDHPQIAQPVTVTAEATISNDPIFGITKSAWPVKPGANKPLVYEIEVTNLGQPANLPITVVDVVPQDTSLKNVGPDGTSSPGGEVITWTRSVDLAFRESDTFTYSVDIADVPSGTVISNVDYYVTSAETEISAGEPYTVTVIDPIFYISKDVQPHPPGSNREMTYILTVLNKGSLATNLNISDVVPSNVDYVSGGTYSDGTVSWSYPSLDTNESTQFTYTVYIDDIAEVAILNETYEVCSDENVVCTVGEVLTSVVKGPTFVATAEVDPIAKKPGAGTGPVTPTLTVQNIGPGNALDAVVNIQFQNIIVSLNDLVDPPVGSLGTGPKCDGKCYRWVGDIGVGETITFTTKEGQNTSGGDPGTNYTATIVISDSLGAFTTEPITATAIGEVTHNANLIPTKSGPPVVGAGQTMTYTIQVWNSGLSTDDPPFPMLIETLPASVTLLSASDEGVDQTIGEQTVISWTLPALSTGERVWRSFSVQVDNDLLSGTELINADYYTLWHEDEITETFYLSNTGQPVTTVVKEVGLIDSYKSVVPELARPGPTNVLTYVVHVVNSSLIDLQDVQVHDLLPWEDSTYQRDAVASSGQIISDIVSIDWSGDVSALSSERITFTVLADPYFEGAITNTAVIQHPSLREDFVVEAVAYITNDPVLQITKSASPDPVLLGNELLYSIKVLNLGQQASNLDIWDTLPENTSYVANSANTNGKLVGDQVHWELPVLLPGESYQLTFLVTVLEGEQVINSDYWVTCAEGVTATGQPVITAVTRKNTKVFLPIVIR